MKNKQFTVAELQEAINNRLSGLAGRKYEGTEFHSWINGEIAAEFEERGITGALPVRVEHKARHDKRKRRIPL